MIGAYETIDRIAATAAAFPAESTTSEWFPEANAAMAQALAAAMLTMYNVEQLEYTVRTWGRGLYQQGRQSVFASGPPLNIASAKRFTIRSEYDAVTTFCKVKLGDYMQLPRREALSPQATMQYIDGQVQRVTWTDRDTDTPIYTAATLTDDLAWNDYDLSAIVGAKKIMCYLHIEGVDNATGSEVWARTKGKTSSGPAFAHSIVANQKAHGTRWIFTNASGIIQIKTAPAPSAWTSIDVFLMDYRDM